MPPQASGARPVRGRGLMRAVFVGYLVVIWAGILYFSVIGLLQQ